MPIDLPELPAFLTTDPYGRMQNSDVASLLRAYGDARVLHALRLLHDFQGACPDATDPDARDPGCAACRALPPAPAAKEPT